MSFQRSQQPESEPANWIEKLQFETNSYYRHFCIAKSTTTISIPFGCFSGATSIMRMETLLTYSDVL